MGGSNSELIGGLRFHINDAERAVHIHEDCSGTKFEMDTSAFKKEVTEALKTLEKDSGIVPVKGKNKGILYIMNDGGTYKAFLGNGTSVKGKIESFLRGC